MRLALLLRGVDRVDNVFTANSFCFVNEFFRVGSFIQIDIQGTQWIFRYDCQTFFCQLADFAAVVDALHQPHHAIGTALIAIRHINGIADDAAEAFRQSIANGDFPFGGRMASFIAAIVLCLGKILADEGNGIFVLHLQLQYRVGQHLIRSVQMTDGPFHAADIGRGYLQYHVGRFIGKRVHKMVRFNNNIIKQAARKCNENGYDKQHYEQQHILLRGGCHLLKHQHSIYAAGSAGNGKAVLSHAIAFRHSANGGNRLEMTDFARRQPCEYQRHTCE